MFEIWVSDLPRTEVCHFPQRQHCSDQASTECTARHPLSQPSSKLNFDKLRNRKTWLKNTNLWAVRMSVQVHKLTNLKNGIESHTSSWEMWRQQIWLLNPSRSARWQWHAARQASDTAITWNKKLRTRDCSATSLTSFFARPTPPP